MRTTKVLLAVLALAGCDRKPEPPVETRPEWRTAAIDGLAPLMTPREIEAALASHGYVQIPCTSRDKLLDKPLFSGSEIPCYRSATRPMQVSLYLLDLNEGRRLAVVNFRKDYDSDLSEAARIAESRAFAQRVRARFGAPFTTGDGSSFRTYYWRRPGGQESLPDMLSTTVGAHFPPNLTMTSMWAYGQEKPSR